MSKWRVDLKLKDLYAIKHCLQRDIENKNTELFIDRVVSTFNLTPEQLNLIKKDIGHENLILENITNEIKDFKFYKNIK